MRSGGERAEGQRSGPDFGCRRDRGRGRDEATEARSPPCRARLHYFGIELLDRFRGERAQAFVARRIREFTGIAELVHPPLQQMGKFLEPRPERRAFRLSQINGLHLDGLHCRMIRRQSFNTEPASWFLCRRFARRAFAFRRRPRVTVLRRESKRRSLISGDPGNVGLSVLAHPGVRLKPNSPDASHRARARHGAFAARRRGAPAMCDYSLDFVASRPAKVGDKLVSAHFSGSITRGFAAVGEPRVAVCLLPGTELAFEREVEYEPPFHLFCQT